MANIAVEDGRTLVVSPWEKSIVQAIEKAIFKSDLGLTPMTAGTVIRLPMPPLTEERRRDITKVLQARRGERPRGRAQRAPRRHRRRQGPAQGKARFAGRRAQAETDIQKLTDKYVADVDALLAAKEKEIMQV